MTQLAVPAAPIRRLRAVPPVVEPRTRDRVPGQALIEAALRDRAEQRPRTAIERLVGVEPVGPGARAALHGVAAQRRVADRLAGLPSGWRVFHSVPVGRGGGDLDHLVVGPGGVFGVASRRDGDGVRRLAARLRRVDRVVAGELAATPAAVPLVVGAGRDDVRCDDLRDRLLREPHRLAPQQVDALVRRFDDARTWQPAAEAGPELLLRFATLVRERRAARRARAAWTAGLGALTATGVALAVPDLLHALGH